MNQHYEPEFKKIAAFILRRDAPSKDLQLNTEYQRQAYPTGQNNS